MLSAVEQSYLSNSHPLCDPSILVNKGSQSSVIDVAVKKCSCNSSWCQNCFKKRYMPGKIERIKEMNWKRVRFLTLTIDPKKFPDGGQEAYEHIKEKKGIAKIFKNIERVEGIEIIDWVWFLEWHENGFPHWHVIVEVEKEGKEGMLGQEVIHKYWEYGAIYEKYVESIEHWNNVTGYMSKRGYFEKKEQTELPEWALKYEKQIRRTGGKVRKRRKDTGVKTVEEESVMYESRDKKKRKEYSVILSKCGASTLIEILDDNLYMGAIECDVPYEEIMEMLPKNGTYIPKVGYVCRVTLDVLKVMGEIVEELYTLADIYGQYLLAMDEETEWNNNKYGGNKNYKLGEVERETMKEMKEERFAIKYEQ